MATARIWIVCRPSARAAVNTALASLAGGEAVRASLPRGPRWGAQPAPRLFFAGWQGPAAELLAVRQALQGVPGVRLVPGMVHGLERDRDGVEDPALGDATTRRSRRGAVRYVAAQFGIALEQQEA